MRGVVVVVVVVTDRVKHPRLPDGVLTIGLAFTLRQPRRVGPRFDQNLAAVPTPMVLAALTRDVLAPVVRFPAGVFAAAFDEHATRRVGARL